MTIEVIPAVMTGIHKPIPKNMVGGQLEMVKVERIRKLNPECRLYKNGTWKVSS
jgi:hypothetical protein